ncbi:hypothetical protein F4604DRAFT_1031886 [Suillus subluteus]|nr:hypothetical protein F4604DRAFT_1031886 [Suillus subluteus]
MVTPVQDWGLIDKSNITQLRNEIPIVRGGRKEYGHLNSALDAMLEIKAVAIQHQVRVPGLTKMIEKYFQAVSQGKHLRKQGWWRRIRKMRDWHGSTDEFKENCQEIWHIAHQTSFVVHAHADNSEVAVVPRVSIRRRRSHDGLVQAAPDLVQRHDQQGDTPTRSTPPNVGLVAQGSSKNSINTNTLQEERMQRMAEMSAAKALEQFILHGRLRLFGGIPPTINNFNGCIVKPGGRAAHTVNYGGNNNRGAAVNVCPSSTEVEGNGADEIDDTSDDESLHDTAIDATRSVSGWYSCYSTSVISFSKARNNPIMTSTQSPTEAHPAIDPHPSLTAANGNSSDAVDDDGEDPH